MKQSCVIIKESVKLDIEKHSAYPEDSPLKTRHLHQRIMIFNNVVNMEMTTCQAIQIIKYKELFFHSSQFSVWIITHILLVITLNIPNKACDLFFRIKNVFSLLNAMT